MRKLVLTTLVVSLPVLLAGCGGGATDSAPVNAKAVLERTVKTLVEFDTYMRRYDYKHVDAPLLAQFNKTLQRDLNAKPPIHRSQIVTKMQSDASFMGYGDLNANGKIDEKEPKLFKLELDADNSRIIITSAAYGTATGHAMPRLGGVFAGVLIGNLIGRQTRAGIKPGHFDKRTVAGAPIGKQVASTKKGKRSRSRAKSGGTRSGK